MDMKTSPLALLKDPSLLKTDALVNGQWVKGSSRFDVNDPATGIKLANVANLGAKDAEAAIAAFAANVSRQVQGEAIGVVQFESHFTGQNFYTTV